MDNKILQLTNDIAGIFNYKLPMSDKRMISISKILQEIMEGVRERAPECNSACEVACKACGFSGNIIEVMNHQCGK